MLLFFLYNKAATIIVFGRRNQKNTKVEGIQADTEDSPAHTSPIHDVRVASSLFGGTLPFPGGLGLRGGPRGVVRGVLPPITLIFSKVLLGVFEELRIQQNIQGIHLSSSNLHSRQQKSTSRFSSSLPETNT